MNYILYISFISFDLSRLYINVYQKVTERHTVSYKQTIRAKMLMLKKEPINNQIKRIQFLKS